MYHSVLIEYELLIHASGHLQLVKVRTCHYLAETKCPACLGSYNLIEIGIVVARIG